MHAGHRPRGSITYGRGDVDGDGHRDLVIVDSRTHLAIAVVADRHLWVRIAADASTRLQSVPDLFGDGRREIVVGRSPAGCCDYRLVDSRALVLRYDAGRLSHVRASDGRFFELYFSLGRGEVFAGVRCYGQRLSQRTVTRLGRHTLRVTTLLYRMNGIVVVQVQRTTHVQRGTQAQATALTRSACPGMSKDGWARRARDSRPSSRSPCRHRTFPIEDRAVCLSASALMVASESATTASQRAATRSPQRCPAAHRSVPSSPR
jgi:hypothetical protein